jgi:hypothetical protein
MRTKDINFGEHYAIESSPGWVRRAIVEAVEIPNKRVYTGARWDFSGHATTVKMARVRWVKDDGTEYENAFIEHVVLSKVVSTWGEHLEHQAVRANRNAQLDASLRVVEDRCSKLLGDSHVIHFARRGIDGHKLSVGQARITSSTLSALLDAAYAKGQKEAK